MEGTALRENPVAQTEMETEVNALDNSVRAIDPLLEVLVEKLEPVFSPPSPMSETKELGEKRVLSPLAERLRVITDNVCEYKHRLEIIIDRITL